MKILIVNTEDIRGGAARATYRLHKALIQKNIDSSMLVQNKSSDDYTVISSTSKLEKLINKLKPTLDSLPVKFYKNDTLVSPSWISSYKIIEKINGLKPDIVHLHWVNSGMIRVEDLKKINAPIVWSLHDNWAFTGGCHIKWDCNRYKANCGSCPRLNSNNEKDLSNNIWKRKYKTYSQIKNITIIGLSKWITNCSKASSLLGDKDHINLPNVIDTNIFQVVDKNYTRELWQFNKKKKLILFGALEATSDINKGFSQLSEALLKIDRDDIEFIVFGANEPQKPPKLQCKVTYIGTLTDDISLVAMYNAVDVMVVPSLQENLSNSIMESLACGTPVVAFNTGGNSDLIDHKQNGFLAKLHDTTDLANGINWILDSKNYDILCENSRQKIIKNFDSKTLINQYIDLYNKIKKS